MSKFKIGDRVIGLEDYQDAHIEGKLGTICHFDNDDYSSGGIGVNWDCELPEGHNCGGHAPQGHGWYVSFENITYAKVTLKDLMADKI